MNSPCSLSLCRGLALALACSLAGCAQFNLGKNIPWQSGRNGELEPPGKVMAVWTDTVMNQAGQKPVRGFGGRLMFYGPAEGSKPIKVKGTLVVYAFVETDRDPTNPVPDRKFVFTSDQLEKHYSKSDLGHSYSVWLPWDEVGGPQAEVSLLIRFTPDAGGAVVVGEQSKHVLPGTVPPPTAVAHVPRKKQFATTPSQMAYRAAEIAAQPAATGAPLVVGQPGPLPAQAQMTAQANAPLRSEWVAPPTVPAGATVPAATMPVAPGAPPPGIESAWSPVLYETPAGGVPTGSTGPQMTTTTINLPPRFGGRMPQAIVRPEGTLPGAGFVPAGAAGPANGALPSAAGQSAGGIGALPATVPGAAASSPPARFSRSRSRVLGGPIARPEPVVPGTSPSPGASLSAPRP